LGWVNYAGNKARLGRLGLEFGGLHQANMACERCFVRSMLIEIRYPIELTVYGLAQMS